jgi:hypothetical protein
MRLVEKQVLWFENKNGRIAPEMLLVWGHF